MQRKTFKQLSKEEFYDVAKLRQDVFIVEQNSVYIDLDGYDKEAIHYLEFDSKRALIAYGRYRKLLQINEISIERVVLAKSARGQGLGKSLIVNMLKDIQFDDPLIKITLSSQLEARMFYRRLGFVEFGEEYDDGGIMHVGMVYQNGK